MNTSKILVTGGAGFIGTNPSNGLESREIEGLNFLEVQ